MCSLRSYLIFYVFIVVRFCRRIIRVEVVGLIMLLIVGVKVLLVYLLCAVVIVVLRHQRALVVVEALGQVILVVP